MNFSEMGIDPELHAEFIDEALDGMAQISDLFVRLEADPDNQEIMGAIFRPIHSIKGNAAFFGLMQTKVLAHELETLLDRIRKGGVAVTSGITDILLRGSDALIAMLQRSRQNEREVQDALAFENLVNAVTHAAEGEEASESILWRKLMDQLGSFPDAMETARELAGFTAAGRAVLDNRPAEDKDTFETDRNAPDFTHEIRTILENTGAEPDAKILTALFTDCLHAACNEESKEYAKKALGEIPMLDASIGLGDEISRESLLGHLADMEKSGAWNQLLPEENPREKPEEKIVEKTENGAADKKTSPDQTEKEPEAASHTSGKTMRIPEERIDAFLSYVGDLVTLGEMYRHLQTRITSIPSAHGAAMELRRTNESFGNLSMALQNSIMAIRKVPMKSLLQRCPRMVRDIATVSGKIIETQILGNEILVDKSLIDTFEAPLTHMVRNAADHGIERPEERLAQGKPEKGHIRIEASEAGEDIILRVKDDGRGLNLDALRLKALELGFISHDEKLSEEALVSLLFRSGVSTAEEVTDISGRGVGMDVVKTSIEQMGGRIAVETTKNQGSVFEIRLPKTVNTQILTGFIVVMEKTRYIFPMESIVRCFAPEEGEIVTIPRKGRCVQDRGDWIRVRRLTECFQPHKEKNRESDLPEGIVVVVESDTGRIAVHVDAIEGVQKMVLKEIQGLNMNDNFFAGGALMGDGTVAMIVHVASITTEK
ncbi:two-component system chemotaxis sensor kinase CheA [Desulfobotulus alkaliphilus]|uniref:Chemotaxis protein CheA n=1 Tax=Desulfobotulus alkaliphilus TaxID=622671 RepID=A0A562RYM6_9BACT|nr:chemotaxis protein CheA [Desulfobotulus alkaliphilus]TWI74211.1 two-component system chemotaxis sensor kinase CheA [Desulfobotulus alkaliphilus]